MATEIDVSFPGNLRVEANIRGFVISTDQPEGFPPKYQKAIIKAMDQCVVKKHILEPPEFELLVTPEP